jgi:uncharacterized membrane protein YphA (DoxX/SURF4 family)
MAGAQNLFIPVAIWDFSQPDSPVPLPILVVSSTVKRLCGAALVIGLRTRLVSLPLAFLILTDVLLVHSPQVFL